MFLPNVTSVAPFAHCLLELNASCYCGIGSAALSQCYRLQVLDATSNDKIDTLGAFAGRLRELRAVYTKLDDVALSGATQLVKLVGSRKMATVAPFGSTLIELDASCVEIDDAGLATATNLVGLTSNSRIKSVMPFASTLLELDASRSTSSIGDAALVHATKLVRLNCSFCEQITTVFPFSQSLRHLRANGSECGLADAGLPLSSLVTLACSGNPKITTIAFCAHSLQELTATGEKGGINGDELAHAPLLRKVDRLSNDKITPLHLNQFVGLHGDGSGTLVRNYDISW